MFSLSPNLPNRLQAYQWRGINLQGEIVTGTLYAISAKKAKQNLRLQGIAINKIIKQRQPFFIKRSRKISSLEMSLFFRQFATLIQSNVSLWQSIKLLNKNQLNPRLHQLCNHLLSHIESGKTLTQGLLSSPVPLDAFTCHLVNIGEQTGTLPSLSAKLATYQEKKALFKKRLQQALFYPSLILLTAILIALVMLFVIVPRFAALFQSMHAELPNLTRDVVYLSLWLKQYYWVGLLPLFTGLVLCYCLKYCPRWRFFAEKQLLNLPLMGKVLLKHHLSYFAYGLATTLSAGAPLLEALKILGQRPQASWYTSTLSLLQGPINKGLPLYQAMEGLPIFTVFFKNMVKIGEESGNLETLLYKAADMYEIEIDYFLNTLTQLLEPLIMIVLGVLIGGLVIAMYLPIFKLGAIS